MLVEGALLFPFLDLVNLCWWSTYNSKQGLFGGKTPSLSRTGLTRPVFLGLL